MPLYVYCDVRIQVYNVVLIQVYCDVGSTSICCCAGQVFWHKTRLTQADAIMHGNLLGQIRPFTEASSLLSIIGGGTHVHRSLPSVGFNSSLCCH